MNVWLWGATALLIGLIPVGVVCLRSPLLDALVALEAGSTVTTIALVLLAVGFSRSIYFVLPLVLSVIQLAGGLVFVRIYGERFL